MGDLEGPILKLLSQWESPPTTKELADALGRPKPTVRKVLIRMGHYRWVRVTGTSYPSSP